MKKTLAILLSLALVICMIPATAFAAPTEVTAGYDVSSISIEPIADQTYTGSAITPAILVKATLTGKDTESKTITLSPDDYTVVYSENTDVGTATVNVTGIEGFSGKTTETTFKINKYDLDAHKVSAKVANQVEGFNSVSDDDIAYFVDGNEATGSVRNMLLTQIKVDVSGNVVSFTPSINLNGSIASVTPIIAKNIETCTITPATNVYYDGTVKNPASLVSINTSTNNYTVIADREIKDKGNYKLTVKGKGEYAGKVDNISVTVKARNSSYASIASIPDQVENKVNIDPAVTDTINGKTVTLVKGKDYNIGKHEFNKAINASTDQYKATIYFIGNYTVDRIVYFNVVKSDYDINQVSATLSTNSAYMYDGKVQTPVITVTKNGSSFSNSYYTVSYEYNDSNGKIVSTTSPADAKMYNVYLVGRSPYAGRKYVGTYTIPKFKFDYVDITATQSSYSSAPNVVVKGKYDDITFVKDKDYTVSDAWTSTATNKGYVTVTSTGTGNLDTGSRSINYSLVTKSIYYCTTEFATGSKQSYQYTGSVIKPQVKVRDGYTILKEGTDYTITYKDAAGKVVYSPKNAGTYTIVIEGKGLYSGTTTMTFYIVGTDISGYTVTLKESSVNATGYSQTPVITSVKKGYYYSLTSNDYTVSYQDANGKTVTSMSAPGTYKVVVTGKNGYSGSTYATFRIVGLPQTLTVDKDVYKVYTTSDMFKIYPKATGDGTGFAYTSSNPAVASVSSNGYVTVHKVGRAVITVTTTGNKKSEPASKEVIVKVYPRKTVISNKPWTDGKKAQMKVRWNYQDGATKYQIKYSRDKNFGSGTYKVKTVRAHGKDYTTQSTTIKSLKRGYTYYFKVRAIYTDPYTGDTYYGAWSNWRSAKTK